jgi:hypothetical protein
MLTHLLRINLFTITYNLRIQKPTTTYRVTTCVYRSNKRRPDGCRAYRGTVLFVPPDFDFDRQPWPVHEEVK